MPLPVVIPGNEAADGVARMLLHLTTTLGRLKLKVSFKKNIKKIWQNLWSRIAFKLKNIQFRVRKQKHLTQTYNKTTADRTFPSSA